jgi:hypothetical protein
VEAMEREKQEQTRRRLRTCQNLLESVDSMCSGYSSPERGAHCHDQKCVGAIRAVAEATQLCSSTRNWPEQAFIAAANAACP